jgi:cold shock CspA family protein
VTGTIAVVNARGFGFATDLAGERYFFHRTDLTDGTDFDALREGDEISFQPFEPTPPKGKRASQVQRIAVDAPEPAV